MSTQQTMWSILGNSLQNYDPVTSWTTFWQHFFNPQYYFGCNFDEDAETEHKVLQKVGSYGKQLGKIMAALEVLIELQSSLDDRLSPQQRATMKEFTSLYCEAQGAVQAAKGSKEGGLMAEMNTLLAHLQEMAGANPVLYHQIVKHLKDALATDEGQEKEGRTKKVA